MSKRTGKGITDIIKNPISYIKEVFAPIPTKLNFTSQNTLKKYGNIIINSPIQIIRTPLSKFLTGALNTLSFGSFGELQKKHGFETLFHLAVIVLVGGQKIIVEKNEVVNVNLFKASDVNSKTEYYNIGFTKQLTLNEMLDNTLKAMGEHKFYSYTAMGPVKNNCQDFIKSFLSSSGLLTPQPEKFINQPIEEMVKEQNEKDGGFLQKGVNFITNLGSKVSRILAKGAKEKNNNLKASPKFIKLVKNDGLRFI